MEGTFAVLGARSLIGRHVIDKLQNDHPNVKIRSWIYEKPKNEEIPSDLFIGPDQLENCLDGVKMVINCHGATDYSLVPNSGALEKHNVGVVTSMLAHLDCPLVHVSSVFVQCSNRWPNVFEPEREHSKYKNEWPFEHFCSSKARGEDLVKKNKERCMIVRLPPLYGDGDHMSLATDGIKLIERFGCIPNIGDHGGALEMVYVGNAAHGIVLAAQKILEDETIEKEVLIIGDNTPTSDIYSILYEPMIENPKRRISSMSLPILPLYYLYMVACWMFLLVHKFVELPKMMQKLPDPSLFYFSLHHWTFFQKHKASFLLSYDPPFSREEAVSLSRDHYRILCGRKTKWSWHLNVE